jgi:hypothetical protein
MMAGLARNGLFFGTLGLAAALIVGNAAKSRAEQANEVWISLSPQTLHEGGAVHATVGVKPHPANRALRITVEGPRFFTSSERQLEGESSAATHAFRWLDLPSGDYKVTVQVLDTDGTREQRAANLLVIPVRPAEY